ncbi:ubiquitin-protein ligase E3A isoform X1 [Ischnura elegans]|uniref:ubiquitin-protein ligase E3A isoform X1 n=2 Tax=Ischnura elegans TaxID=197161 RepID=UPI001ED87275|nr:ubiquitin-protein ligase E3A isoform X1 [Ischnura elegans]
MTSKDKEYGTGDGEASSNAETEESTIHKRSLSSKDLLTEGATMKRAAAKKLIERYFFQLIDGCGNPKCDNENCASSGKAKKLTRNQAAAQAIRLFAQEARLCDTKPTKVPKTQDSGAKGENDISSSENISRNEASGADGAHSGERDEPRLLPNKVASHSLAEATQRGPLSKDIPFITEEKLLEILETCKRESSYSLLIRTLGEVYSSTDSLNKSFIKKDTNVVNPLDSMLDRAPLDLKNMKKEDVRTLEGDMDKEIDSQEIEEGESSSKKIGTNNVLDKGDDVNVDLVSLRRAYEALFEVPSSVFESALVNALTTLTMELDVRLLGDAGRGPDFLNVFVIVAELPVLGTSEYLEVALPKLCRAAARLPVVAQARLAKVWARHCKSRIKTLLQALQQLVTLRVMSGVYTRDYCVNDEEGVTAPTKVMKILYYANILAGELDPPDLRQEEEEDSDRGSGGLSVGSSDSLLSRGNASRPRHKDPLGVELGVDILDARRPYIPFSEFYNEPLSDAIEMDKDFAYYKSEADQKKFSFMNYSFILTPATKTLGLYYDNRIRMYSERRMSYFQNVAGQHTNPYLRLKVKRDHIIDDTLVELEMAMENPNDLKKQLVVEFEGEQGIDEGGVSKEFFQLIVEEIFNPDYGMFTFQQETGTVWFNPTSFESDAQFTLIGIVLGLAIYNNIILDVHFPMVVYRKLMGKKGTFHDLEEWNPTLYTGLKELLEYEEDDIEDTFMQTFRICYQDVFGSAFFHELKEGGDQIYVTQENKKEFVDLYADFLLNKSVEKQFKAFRRGFQMVTDESPLHLLFRPEEVEQLVCGSKNFDFNELEEATEYDGYTDDSPIIKYFWEIVHSMSLESKRKLLQFATGSDRVPVGGLSKLKLIIARNGPDSDRLPTAHTCFNVLMLPEYESKEKLNDRLLKAINYSKGFGML